MEVTKRHKAITQNGSYPTLLGGVRILVLSFFFGLIFVCGRGFGGDHSVTSSLGKLTEPLASTINFSTFNPGEGESTKQNLGEILSLFDQFLKAQQISPDGTPEDLDRLYALISRDFILSTAQEDFYDDLYDEIDDKSDKLAEKLEDWEDDQRDADKTGEARKKEKQKPDLGAYLGLRTQAEPLKAQRNQYRQYVAFEKPTLTLLNEARRYPENLRLRQEACNVAIRNLYSLFADQFLGKKDFDPNERNRREKSLVIKAFVFKAQRNRTRFYDDRERGVLVGRWAAKQEATNLIDPSRSDRFVGPEILAKLSHEEVSRLDISPTNPMWHTHEVMSKRPDTWTEIERFVEKKVTQELLSKKSFRKDYPDFSYSLSAARRVLFWDDIKVTATSPKADVRDSFDQEWKIKWGEESVVEPVANRLRLLAGSRFSDLCYADICGSSHLLILPSALQRSMNPNKVMPLTKSEFVREMSASRYNFNAEPFILSSGVITESNADEILAGLPLEAMKPFRKERLIGRTWIRFRESMVEAKHDVINSGGPVSTDSEVAARDRALRQAMVVAFWTADVDVKEDNHRAVWVRDFGGYPGDQYLEYFHDPGSSLGGLRRSGEVNKLHYRSGTGGFLWADASGMSVYSNSFQLYRPGAWDFTTFADQLSGVRHIARISKAEIREAVSHGGMPDFYQDSLAWRLIKRRDLLAKVYNVALRDDRAGEAPTVAVPLSSRSERAAAAATYQVPLSEIEKDLVRTGNLDAFHLSGDTKETFIDILAHKATIRPCEKTVLSGIIRDYRHPSGFVMRMNRFNDGEPYRSRRYKSSK
jgi:hypothetical protein